MRKRLEAARATYENYLNWYKKYAKNVEMSTSEYSEEEFQELYRDAKYAQSRITDPKARKNYMRNFSQVVARTQRRASELQLRVTWTAVKRTNEFITKNKQELEDAYIKEILTKKIVNGRRNLNAKQLKEVEEEVERRFASGVSEEIISKAKEKVAKKLKKEIELVDTYSDLTWVEFKKQQKKILKKYRDVVGNRSVWNEAFAIYYERPMKKVA